MSSRLDSIRTVVNLRLADYRAAVSGFRAAWDESTKAEDTLVASEEAKKIVQAVAQAVQQKAHDRIAGVVSRCLSAVFDEPYEFRVLFEQKRGRTEARLVFCRGELEVDPLTASGGGVVDVAAFALRLSALLLTRPPLRRVVVLDEPFKFVSEAYRGRVRLMLETLAAELDVQFVVVTHIRELVTGTVIDLG